MERQPKITALQGLPWYAWAAIAGAGYLLLRNVGVSLGELVAQRRGRLWELYDRNRAFPNVTPARITAMIARAPELGRMAVELQETAGTFNDDEDKVYSVFRQLRSRYELYWLNKTFAYGFPNSSVAPQLGAFLDDTLTDDEWIPIVRAVEQLPTFAA